MYFPETDQIGFDQKIIWLFILSWHFPLLPTLEAAKENRVSLGVDNVVWGVWGCPPWSPLIGMYLPETDEIGFDQKMIWFLILDWLSPLLHSANLTVSMAICPFQRLLDLAYLTTKPKILKPLAQLEISSTLGSKKRVDSFGTHDSRHTYLFHFL